MKTLIVSCLLLIACSIIQPQKITAQHASVSFQIFYDELSPYGKWVQTPDYGYVWVPDVAEGFEPYSTNGYWAYTDEGWTWVSLYNWGWAAFHYGRWFNDPYYGYVWIPGTEWGPGWVVWRHSDDYYGWAPIGPGISITIAYSSGYYIPYNHWRFVRCRDFGRRDLHRYYINRSGYTTIIHNTYIINNIRVDNRHHVSYNPGPDRNDVEKRGGRRVRTNIIQESNAPVRNERSEGVLQMYRPEVRSTISSEARPAPAKVSTTKDLRTVRPNTVTNEVSPAQNKSQPSIFQHSETHQNGVAQPTQPSLRSNQPSTQPRQVTQPPSQPGQPSTQPRVQQSQPAQQPKVQPSPQPRVQPSQPAQQPKVQPSPQPRVQPSQPAQQPKVQPSTQPRVQPSQPAQQPKIQPSPQPRVQPSQPAQQPKVQPSSQPRVRPNSQPKAQPSPQPRSSSQPRQEQPPPRQIQPSTDSRNKSPK